MKFSDIERLAIQPGVPSMNPSELLHVLALKGLLAEFNRGAIGKTAASKYKTILKELVEKEQPDYRYEAMRQESDLEDKIRTANLLHCNPYALCCQMAHCISLLKDDGGTFFNGFKTDCYEIHGRAILDPIAADAEREEIEENLKRLTKRLEQLHSEHDMNGIHIVSRAVDANRARLEAITRDAEDMKEELG